MPAAWNPWKSSFLSIPGSRPSPSCPASGPTTAAVRLPAVITAPDFGQMLLVDRDNRHLKGRLEGSRAKKTVDFFVELPALRAGDVCALSIDSRLAARSQRVDRPGHLEASAAGLVRRLAAQRPVGYTEPPVQCAGGHPGQQRH